MKKRNIFKKVMISALAFSMMVTPMAAFAAPPNSYNDALEGTGSTDTNETDVNNDLGDFDIIDKDARGSLTIHKYDLTSAQEDGLVFNWSDTDHDSDGTDSTLTTADGKQINITSTGQENAEAAEALKEYAIKGVEFTYLRVGDVKTFSDVNEDGVNGDIELIYGVDTDLMKILSLEPYNAESNGEDFVAATQIDGTNYYTSQQINDALKAALEVGTYDGTYATEEGEGTGVSNDSGERLDGKEGITVKDALEEYITTSTSVHAAGTAMEETDADGLTGAEDLDLGLYLIVETKVPENVTDTTNPWFVQIPMTDIDGQEWFYDISCYPKNQTGHPTLDKKVRNAYGTPGLNYDSTGPATYTDGEYVNTGDTYSADSEIVTNGDTLSGDDYAAWLADDDKSGDYEYSTTVTASEGDILDYILVTKLPNITSSATYLTTYELLDTLSDGLRYNNDVKIAIYNSEEYANVNDTTHAIDVWTMQSGQDYNYNCEESKGKTDGSTTIDITLTEKGLEKINKNYYDGQHYLVAYYTATVESDATTVLGDEGNPNDVTLVWERTSDQYYNTLEDRSIVYTYGIDLTKTFSDENTKEQDFKAVQFVLYNETEDYYVQAKQSDVDGLYYATGKATAKEDATVFSPSAEGKMVINGLEADNYKMTEIATAKGYSILQNQIDILINPSMREITPSSVHYMTVADDHDIEHPSDDQDLILSDGTTLVAKEEGTTDKENMVIGELTPASATVDDVQADMCVYGAQHLGSEAINATKNSAVAAASENADVIISVMNSKAFLLPQTGGAGLYLLTIVGVAAVVIGVYSVSHKNKKKAC